ncbi:flavodoxin [Amphidinium carterae]
MMTVTQRSRMSRVLLLLLAVAAMHVVSNNGLARLFVSVSSSRVVAGRSGCLIMAAGRAAAGRQSPIAMRAVGLLYSTQTGNTEEAASIISEATGLEVTAVDDLDAADLGSYDGLIVGCPTWNTGADEYRSGTAWDDLLDDIRGLSLSGKPVAVFGCGDSQSYGDNFCDGIEELRETFKAAGAKNLGYVDASGYEFEESKSVRDGKFLGLPLDQDNEAEMSEERVAAWVAQLKSEGMPL